MLKKIFDNFEEVFCAVCVGTMVLCLTIQVLIRVISGSSLAWTEELSRYSFLWTVYIGAALMAKHNGHVRITAQFLPFGLKTRLVFRIAADFIWVAFNIFIAWHCWAVIADGMDYPEYSPTLHVAKYYVELVIPAGFLLMSFRIIYGYLERYRKGTLLELVQGEAG